MVEGDDDRFTLVSSFYGPGATGCWYLTVLSCFVYWTLHREKRRSGSIDSGLIAVLTFPAVAAAHLISQAHGYQTRNRTSGPEADDTILKLSAALEASLIITETSLAVYVLLFLIAVGFRCFKRALLLAVVGLFAFAAKVYLYIACRFLRSNPKHLSRLILTDFWSLILVISSILLLLVWITLSLAGIMIERRQKKEQRSTAKDADRSRSYTLQPYPFMNSLSAKLMTFSTILFLPASIVASGATGQRLVQYLFPRTNVSIKELDQAVAVLAGATVLAFSIYSAANAHYRSYSERSRLRQEHGREELVRAARLRQLLTERIDRHST